MALGVCTVSGPVTRSAYEKLIEEDIAALPENMAKLEREHIIVVLQDSVTRIYGEIKTTVCSHCRGRGKATYTRNTYYDHEETCHVCGGSGRVPEREK